jgi:enoyl-CoA hydratase
MTEANIRYESPAEGVARITLARPDKHNAINPQMIYDVNAAFDRAVRDESV